MISWALLFGQSAAVNGFNRVPALIASTACRLLASMTWHYFDDYAVLDVERHAASDHSAQTSLRELSSIIGFAVSPTKSKNPSREQVYLGVHNNLGNMHEGFLSSVPTEQRVSRLALQLQSYCSGDYIDEAHLKYELIVTHSARTV